MKLIFRSFILYNAVMCSFSLSALASLHQSGVYLGTSFGVSQLSGKRTDSISDGTTTLTIFNDKTMDDTSLEANLFAGYRYSPSQTNLVFSIEGFFTFGPFENKVYRDVLDGTPAPFAQAIQLATLKRSWGYGLASRVGYIVHPSVMPYLLIGVQRDRFTYESIGSTATSSLKRKTLTGLDLGGGVETCFKGVKTALEFKYTRYQKTTFDGRDQIGDLAYANTRPKAISLSLRFVYVF